ncbi:MAG: methyltransferase domain-containing protein [Proteobacteria bacterium]|nr:methyltransferase domain-containing protein [Pseudomonadota bacterium]
MTGPLEIFDRTAVRRHRDRAAARLGDHDFLIREVAERLRERLGDIKRDFSCALDLGGAGPEARLVVRGDLSPAMVARRPGPRVVLDEEGLPFAPGCFDLVTSLLALHWVNDLPGALLQIRWSLAPDGLFMAAMLGGETLIELREALARAESEQEGGVSPRLSPTVDLQDMGGLLQRAGFALPVVDVDTITVTYADAFALMHDLRGMGETNALNQRRKRFTRRATLMAAAEIYRERFADADGRLPATFQIIWLTAWAPHESQQQPLRPGSAKTRLADALDAEEKPAGDKARPG